MCRGEESERGPLTSEEREELQKEIQQFCENTDLESYLDLTKGMVFIREGTDYRFTGVKFTIGKPSVAPVALKTYGFPALKENMISFSKMR